MVDGGDVSAGVDDGISGALGEAGQLELERRQGQVRVRGAEELDAAPALDAVHEVGADNGADRDGEAGVDAPLRDPALQLGNRQRRVLAPREVQEALLGHQLVQRRLATRKLRRRLAVARPRVLALVSTSRRAALRRSLATTETRVLGLAMKDGKAAGAGLPGIGSEGAAMERGGRRQRGFAVRRIFESVPHQTASQ